MNKIFRIKGIKFLIIILLPFTIYYLLFPIPVKAVCPICTVAVAGGLGLSRYLGIDDAITGIWAGGLITSVSFWSVDWLIKKWPKKFEKLDKRTLTILTLIFWYALTFLPLYFTDIIGHPFNKILGMDKLIFGSLVGIGSFIFGVWADKKVRKIKGRQLFQYQKVAFPVLSLAIVSLIIYYYGGYLY